MSRAERNTFKNKVPEFYSDFTINLDMNPTTGLLAKVKNEESIKQSIKNLILTKLGERFFEPKVGSKIHALLFEPIDSVSEELLKSSITQTIKNHEKRANLKEVNVVAKEEENGYLVTIIFEPINIPTQIVQFNVFLKRIR